MSRIKSDEQVIFFPTSAELSDDRQAWIVPIHGWIFEPEWNSPLRNWAIDELADVLEHDLAAVTSSKELLDRRLRPFVADNERGKRIGIRVGDQLHVLDESGSEGHFRGMVRVDVDQLSPEERRKMQIDYRAITDPGDERALVGVSYLLPEQGISVISDIDDTIKISDVHNKRELIRNTFLKDFQAFAGMSGVYANWARDGATFHYASASPWQLYVPLSEFLASAGFPQGTYQLKEFRWKDSRFLNLFADPLAYKLAVIEPFLRRFPRRTVVLVGDDTEKDPEAYGELARQYPSQIAHIYIRQTADIHDSRNRYATAFRGVPAGRWTLFSHAGELPQRPVP